MDSSNSNIKSEWENIFNTINDAITIHDTDFNIIKVNKSAEILLGKSAKDILQNKCFKSYHGTACAPELCPSCNVLKTHIANTSEIYEPSLGKWLEVKALPRFDEKNEFNGLVHIVKDITDRKYAEEELKKKLHDLQIFYNSTVGRELQMIKMKDQISGLNNKIFELKNVIAELKNNETKE